MSQREQLTLEVIDRINRRVHDAHAYKEYRPVAAALMLRDADGAVLLVQSAKDPDDWGCPQGGIEGGESVTVALARELHEELLLGPQSFAIDAYLGEEDLAAESGRANMRGFSVGKRYFFFALTCLQPEALRLDPVELAAARWVQPRDGATALSTTRAAKREMLLRRLRLLS